jgi:hypothetical protein
MRLRNRGIFSSKLDVFGLSYGKQGRKCLVKQEIYGAYHVSVDCLVAMYVRALVRG